MTAYCLWAPINGLKPSIAGRHRLLPSFPSNWPRQTTRKASNATRIRVGPARVTAARQMHQPERGVRPRWSRPDLHTCTDQPVSLYIPSPPPKLFLLFFFSSPSQCRGFTCISEDSSEITFLLVENYNLTALDQLRKDWLRNFWSPSQSRSSSIDFHSFIANIPTGSVVKKVCPLAVSLCAASLVPLACVAPTSCLWCFQRRRCHKQPFGVGRVFGIGSASFRNAIVTISTFMVQQMQA